MGLWRFIVHLIFRGRLSKFIWLLFLGINLSIVVASCSISNAQNSDVELTLVSYAVTRPAYKKIIPKFVAEWEQQHNQKIRFYESYAPSGAQTRAVIDGLDADVVQLALALDMQKVENAGLIEAGWEKEVPNNGIVTQSVAVLVTRKGNPKQIKTWEDLTTNDLDIITANPKTSGVARWNFLALWGFQKQIGMTDTQAFEFTKKVYQNVPIMPRDAREASDVFINQDQGDILINYENEIILAGLRERKRPYIVPDINISIENPVAVVDKNVEKHGNREIAEAFVKYLFTAPAQREFAKIGFRPIDPNIAEEFSDRYPPIKKLFTVKDLGGWDKVQNQFFDNGAAFDKIQASIR